jgi:hypothetical protein
MKLLILSPIPNINKVSVSISIVFDLQCFLCQHRSNSTENSKRFITKSKFSWNHFFPIIIVITVMKVGIFDVRWNFAYKGSSPKSKFSWNHFSPIIKTAEPYILFLISPKAWQVIVGICRKFWRKLKFLTFIDSFYFSSWSIITLKPTQWYHFRTDVDWQFLNFFLINNYSGTRLMWSLWDSILIGINWKYLLLNFIVEVIQQVPRWF